MNILAITQARSGSLRLPGKVLKKIDGISLLEIHLKRLLKSKRIDQLLIATTVNQEDDSIVEIADKLNIPAYRGSVNNVLERFYLAAKLYEPTWIVRLTSDCPLIDADLVDLVIEKALSENLDYCSNSLEPSFPDGMDVEIFKASALEKAAQEATLASDKEHVTPYLYRNSTFFNKNMFVSANYSSSENYSAVRLTIDEPEDFEVIRLIIKKLGIEKDWKTYADFYVAHKEINLLNKNIKRNEGYIKSIKNDSQNDK